MKSSKKTSYYFFLFNFMVYLTSTSSAVLTQNRWTVFKGRVQTLFWPQGHMSTDQVVFHELPLGLIFQYFQFQIIAETFLSRFTIHVLYELYSVRLDNWNLILYTYKNYLIDTADRLKACWLIKALSSFFVFNPYFELILGTYPKIRFRVPTHSGYACILGKCFHIFYKLQLKKILLNELILGMYIVRVIYWCRNFCKLFFSLQEITSFKRQELEFQINGKHLI